jgi:hypothetical protein
MTTKSFIAALLWAWLLACGAVAAQQVSIGTDSALHEEPRPDARVISQLKAGANAEVIGKQGAWMNLKTAAGTGWVMSFNVRFASEATAPSGGGTASALNRLVAPRQKPATTATIGIRGLEAEDLKAASFDSQQMGLLDKFATSRQEAESAARASGLSAVRVDYLSP